MPESRPPGAHEDIDPLRRLVHDVRTPLAVICGYADLLARRGDELAPEQRHQYVGEIRQAAEEISTLLDGMQLPKRG